MPDPTLYRLRVRRVTPGAQQVPLPEMDIHNLSRHVDVLGKEIHEVRQRSPVYDGGYKLLVCLSGVFYPL